MKNDSNINYPNIFKNRHSRKEEEDIFYKLTGINLKDFLYEKYINENLTIDDIAKIFSCSYTTIYNRIKYYGFNRSVRENEILKRKNIQRNGEYTKTPLDIEIETGRKFTDIVLEYTEQGLAPSEIARKLKLTNQTHIKKTLKQLEYNKIEPLYPDVFKNRRTLNQCEKIFLDKYRMNLKDFLYQKHVVEGLSTYAIAPLFGCNNSSIHNHLKHYGFANNLSQARKRLIKDGAINYNDIFHKGRATAQKSQAKSNAEEWTRYIFKNKLYEKVIRHNLEILELITGVNELNILHGKEVDMAFIIINTKLNKFFKFAIEFNGNYWHKDIERDIEKSENLASKNWICYTITDDLSNMKIEDKIDDICNKIANNVLEYNV